jgi:hypothetical protein
MTDNNEYLAYDGTIEDEGEEREFTLLTPGEYPFTVQSFERKYASTGAPMVKLELDINGTTVYDNLVLMKKTEWKLSQFFIAIGLKKRGEPLSMNWAKVPTCTGMLKIKHRTHENSTYNSVDKYLDPETHPYKPAEPKGWTPGAF